VQQALGLGPVQMWPYLAKYTLRLRRFIVDVQPKLYEGMTDANAAPILADLHRGAQMIYQASKRHRIRRYPGRLMVITAEDLSDQGIGAFDVDPTGGWSQWADEAIYIGKLPCTHSHLLDVEHAAILAELLNACLARASSMACEHGAVHRDQALDVRV
jgi:hypothetical protein